MLKKYRSTLVACMFCAAAPMAVAEDLVLVQDGKPAAVVVTPDRQEPGAGSAISAAKVFVDHIAQMSGATLPVVKASELGKTTVSDGKVTAEAGKAPGDVKTFVFIGEGALAKQAGFNSDGLAVGGIHIKTSGNALGLIGSALPGDPQTTQYAVIECLESLGCRYLWPGESGKIVPKRSTVTIASIDRQFSPPIQQRAIRFFGMSERPLNGLKRLGLEKAAYDAGFAKASETPLPITWAQWQRLGGNVGIAGGAAGCGLRGGWKEWGQSHPEWFAQQVDGSRDQSKAGDRWRLCISNQGLVEHVAEDIIQRIKENPKLTCVSLCPNDGGFSSFCLCDECKKLDPPDAPKIKMLVFPKTGEADRMEIEAPALTDRFVHYWNQIAERVTKVYPNELLLVEAYSYYSTPPVREKLNPNIVVRYVPSTLDGWEGWKKAGTKHIYWRPNILLAGRKDGNLHVDVADLAERMALMADDGMVVTDFDSIIHNWAVQGLNYYAAARLNWDPHLTEEQILSDYCQNGFGPAGNVMEQFFKRVEEITIKENRVFTPDNIAELRGLLTAADKSAGADEAIVSRIAFIRMGLNYTDLFATLTRMTHDADGKTGAELAELQAKARPLLALNYLVLRDFVKNHNLVLNSSYLLWMTNDFALWGPIGGNGYRPAPAVLALGDDPAHTLTGHEDSLDAMLAAFGITKDGAAAAKPTGQPASNQTPGMDADENGKPIQVLK